MKLNLYRHLECRAAGDGTVRITSAGRRGRRPGSVTGSPSACQEDAHCPKQTQRPVAVHTGYISLYTSRTECRRQCHAAGASAREHATKRGAQHALHAPKMGPGSHRSAARRRCMFFAQMAGLLAMPALLPGACSADRGRRPKPETVPGRVQDRARSTGASWLHLFSTLSCLACALVPSLTISPLFVLALFFPKKKTLHPHGMH